LKSSCEAAFRQGVRKGQPHDSRLATFMVQAEQQFSDLLCKTLKAKFEPAYAVSEKKALLYKIHLDPDLHIQPAPSTGAEIQPKRGVYAFETDLLVEHARRPLVVFELKLGISSHDVITYSAKAAKHKEIYPFLRYGLLIGGQASVDARFFTHNFDLDFVLAMSLDDTTLVEQFRRFTISRRTKSNRQSASSKFSSEVKSAVTNHGFTSKRSSFRCPRE
jgi:hypothetical protein